MTRAECCRSGYFGRGVGTLVAGGQTGDRGQALVEAALVLGVFLILLLGIFDLGTGVFYNNVLSNAAREGARKGITLSASGTPTAADICREALYKAWLPNVSVSSCVAGTPPASSSPSWCQPSPTPDYVSAGLEAWVIRGTSGSQVQVWLAYPYTPIASNLVMGSNASPIWLCASSSMYVE